MSMYISAAHNAPICRKLCIELLLPIVCTEESERETAAQQEWLATIALEDAIDALAKEGYRHAGALRQELDGKSWAIFRLALELVRGACKH